MHAPSQTPAKCGLGLYTTVAAQEDLGYTVNYAGADPFSHIFTVRAAGGGASRSGLNKGDDIRHGPIYVIDAAGTVVRVIRQN